MSMQRAVNLWTATAAWLTTAGLSALAAHYYVDSTAGNDANSGTSEGAPWRTLTKVNATTFQPGDVIRFKTGAVWTGRLNPKGSGAPGNPIVIDQYGSGPKPVINANGATGWGAVYLFNQQYWEINNLEIINDAAEGGDRRGIYLSASNFVGNVVNHLHVRNCYIHNIKGIVDQISNAAKRTGGIIVEVIEDRAVPTRFNNILIENCVISTVDNQGIALNNRVSVSDYPSTPEWEARKFTHVVIRGNRINDVAKNAMIIRLTDETGLVEHNVCWDTAYRAFTGNTIFSRSARGTVFQFNEGYQNRAGELDPSKNFDGSLYDADLQSPGVIFQYSYSHDNAHGLYWQCTDARDTNVIVRYNVSRNDRGIIFCMNYEATSTYVYNNTVFVSSNLSPRIIDERRNANKTYWFYNNIIYNLSPTASYQWFNGKRTFENNTFYGYHPPGEPDDPYKLTSDPLLVNPGSGGLGLHTLAGYQLQPGSPAIDSGRAVSNHGGRDLWGNAVPFNSATDRGAHEWTAAPITNAPPAFTQPPQSQTVIAGSNVMFAVVVTGTPPLQRQWRKNGVALMGKTDPILTLTAVSPVDAGDYDMVVANAFGAVTSSVATLTVKWPVATHTVAPFSRATIRDGDNINTNLDETALGYVMVKYHTGGLSAKGYFGFDLSGKDYDPEAPAEFRFPRAANCGAQHLQLWALNQAYPGMSDDLTWTTAQANPLSGNHLLTNGSFTATALGAGPYPGGAGTSRFTVSPPWGEFVYSNRLVLVLTGVDDATNASAGFRVGVTNSAEPPAFIFSGAPPVVPPPQLDGAQVFPGGEFGFSFTSLSGAGFIVLCTTNLALPLVAWSVLGMATEFAPGQYRFRDTQSDTNVPRFYRIRSS